MRLLAITGEYHLPGHPELARMLLSFDQERRIRLIVAADKSLRADTLPLSQPYDVGEYTAIVVRDVTRMIDQRLVNAKVEEVRWLQLRGSNVGIRMLVSGLGSFNIWLDRGEFCWGNEDSFGRYEWIPSLSDKLELESLIDAIGAIDRVSELCSVSDPPNAKHLLPEHNTTKFLVTPSDDVIRRNRRFVTELIVTGLVLAGLALLLTVGGCTSDTFVGRYSSEAFFDVVCPANRTFDHPGQRPWAWVFSKIALLWGLAIFTVLMGVGIRLMKWLEDRAV